MGRTKGGLNTKIHALINARSQPVVIALSAGNQADVSLAAELTECLPEGSTLIGDKAYDARPSGRQRPLKELKPAFPLAATERRLCHSHRGSTGVVTG
jgi:hypothetical protein